MKMLWIQNGFIDSTQVSNVYRIILKRLKVSFKIYCFQMPMQLHYYYYMQLGD